MEELDLHNLRSPDRYGRPRDRKFFSMSKVKAAMGSIILEANEDPNAMFLYLLKVEEATRVIDRENLDWIEPMQSGLKWRTNDGKTHEMEFDWFNWLNVSEEEVR